MEVVFICAFTITMLIVFLSCAIFWDHPNNDKKPSYVDQIRDVARKEGLVLHAESYRNGTEAYVPPRWEYVPYTVDRVLLKV